VRDPQAESPDNGQRRARDVATADLSVVIPCLNAADVLPRQLEALASQEWNGSWDVIVADNGSTDETRAIARSYERRLPSIRIVEVADRRGRQHACNAGALVAGRAIVFIDADDEIAPGYVAAVGEALARHPLVAARIDDATLNTGWILDGSSGVQSADLQQSLGFLPFGSGGTLGVQHDVFATLGGFADGMDYAEDVDFCWRAQLSGVPILFVPDAVVRYRYRPSLRSMFHQHRNFGRASALLYRTYRGQGMPGRATRTGLREWWQLSKGFLLIRSRADAARWSRRLGRNVGRLQGSVRYRVWYP
jgi:GT2 family glycosyltransferase